MTVRDLIIELMGYDMDANVTVNVVTDEENFDRDFELDYNSNSFSSSRPYLQLNVDFTEYVIKEEE